MHTDASHAHGCCHFHADGIDPCHCGAPDTLKAFQRISADLDRRQLLGGAGAVLGMFAGFGLAAKPA